MSIGLITRVKCNYNLCTLIASVFKFECSFEQRNKCIDFLSKYYEESVCLVPSARDAIYELLIRLPQKTVVIPAYTCIVVVEAVRLAGKEIIYARTNTKSFNAEYLEYIKQDYIIIATHQYGLPCNIKEIADKCNKVGAILIEDCATSMGTTIDGQLTGTFGDFAVISLNQSKTLTVPPFGGILIGKNADMLNEIKQTAQWHDGGTVFKIKGLIKGGAFVMSKNPMAYKLMHWLTIDRKGKLQRTEHEKPSETKTDFYKVRFTEWQASILVKQLNKLEKIFQKRKEIYAYYDKHINNPLLVKPPHYENAVCTRYAVLVADRRTFYKKCLDQGVDMDFSHCSIGCPKEYFYEHAIADKILNLPFYYDMSEKEMKKVVDVVNNIR